ncbi:MAG: hypothetical protein WCK35_02820 [Chloroflexota bacterium]
MVIITILAILLIVLLIIGASTPPQKYLNKRERLIADLNKERQTHGYGPSDEMYAAVTKQHSDKSLEQITEYIKSHQKNNDPYWEYNRMEYKILMERQRLLLKREKL